MLIGTLKSLFSNSSLIKQFVRRDVSANYRGSSLGILWSLIIPLMMLAVYSFVFTVVFSARFGDGVGDKKDFAIILFSGLIIHSFFVDSLNKAPILITSNVNFVQKVIFPLEILIPSCVFASLFQFVISFVVLLAGILFIYGELHLTLLLFPIIILPLLILLMGLCWLVASLGVYIRDIAHIMPILSTILLFMSTIFYPASSLPAGFQTYIYLNPLSIIVDQFRLVVLEGNLPNWNVIGIYYLISISIFIMGLWWFAKTRKGFADVL